MKSGSWIALIKNFSSAMKKIIVLSLFLSCLFLAQRAQAAYFVDNGASGCSNGSTSYNPEKRNCAGGRDTVYTTWNNAYNAISAGTEGNHTVVNVRSGTYVEEMNIRKAWTTWQKYPNDSTKPILDGNNHTLPSAGGERGLINVWAHGVTIDGIEIRNTGYRRSGGSQGSGIHLYSVTNAVVKNCYVHHIGSSGIFIDDSDYVLVEGNELHETDYYNLEGGGNWGGAIFSRYSNHITIRLNLIHGVGGEGIDLLQWGENYLVEYNTLYDVLAVAIYPDQSRNVVIRYNLIYHTLTPRYTGYSAGIILSREGWWGGDYSGYGTNYEVYGNLTAGCHFGFAIAEVAAKPCNPFVFGCNGTPDNKISNVRVYNNTFIEAKKPNGSQRLVYIQPGSIGSGIEFRNNIFWQTEGTIADVPSGAIWANNLWSKAPDTDARSSSDPTYSLGYPSLKIADYFHKTSGWTSLTPNSLSGSEFALRSTALYAIGRGGNLGSSYNHRILELDASNFITGIFPLLDQKSKGSGFEIGADIFVTLTGALSPPEELMLSVAQE